MVSWSLCRGPVTHAHFSIIQTLLDAISFVGVIFGLLSCAAGHQGPYIARYSLPYGIDLRPGRLLFLLCESC